MKQLLISAAIAAFAVSAHAADTVDNTREAASQSAKAAESAVKSQTADTKVERIVHKHKAQYHKSRAKAAAKAVVE